MINPHAILLTRKNFPAIMKEFPETKEAMLEVLLDDSVEELVHYYIVTQRNSQGLPYFIAMTPEAIEREFDTVVVDRFMTSFERI